jgi:hypothetical protein
MWVSMNWRNRCREAGLDIARSHEAVNDRAGAFKVGWLADVSRLPVYRRKRNARRASAIMEHLISI